MQLYIAGIGVLGPGLDGWPKSQAVLLGQAPYATEVLTLEAPSILSGRERRRSSPSVRLALRVSQEAVEQSGLAARELPAVFGSSAGSGLEVHQILDALTKPQMPVSPTQFHNSVHNSAVGYWCIATGCHEPSTSIAGYDHTFPATLLKGAAQAVTEERPVLITVSDCPFPRPLDDKRHIFAPFGVAFVVGPEATDGTLAKLSLSWQSRLPDAEVTAPSVAALRDLWQGNPAGQSLPLLEVVASGSPGRVNLRYPDKGGLGLEVSPC